MTDKFARGEVRKLSIDLIETNRTLPFDTIVEMAMESYAMTKAQARSHIRWLVREGLVNKAEELQATWPKRARKAKAKAKPKKAKKAATVKTTAAQVADAVTPSETPGGSNRSMAELAKKFSSFRKEKQAA